MDEEQRLIAYRIAAIVAATRAGGELRIPRDEFENLADRTEARIAWDENEIVIQTRRSGQDDA